MRIILASTSRYRRAQLAAAGIEVECIAPGVDETPIENEAPAALAARLARAKADAVARMHPDALVIGADQVAVCAGTILHKPGSALAQRDQLRFSAGREVGFMTAVCVIHHATGGEFAHVDTTRCRVRALDEASIDRYVAAEPAWDCCGGFKVEGRGISLFDAIHSEDPSALVGLPLIAVCRGLRELGVAVP